MKTIQRFIELDEESIKYAGGKGRSLARLYKAGFSVPEGFVVLPSAFEDGGIEETTLSQVKLYIDDLRKRNDMRRRGRQVSFAVRSSALNEDSEQASFAGEFETVLGVSGDQEVIDAILKVYHSGDSDRVKAYSTAKGIGSSCEVAVVVQVLVSAEMSGVLFTADPVTGSRSVLTGNFVRGMGEALVSGESNACAFRFRRPRGAYEGPGALRPFAGRLYAIAARLEKLMGAPQDIEWAIEGGRIFLLQARPITTLRGSDPATGEYNDSLTGDYLWSNANLTEATPDIMTPLTWSLLKILHIEAEPFKVPGGYPMVGNIGGHPYVNLSLMVSLLHVFGTDVRKILRKWEEVFGFIPEGTEVPLLPLKMTQVLSTVPANIRWEIQVNRLLKELPRFIASSPAWCEDIRGRIEKAKTGEELAALWMDIIKPRYLKSCLMLRTVMKKFQEPAFKLNAELEKLVGKADAKVLMSNLRGDASLASLGPLTAISSLAAGELTREAYLRQYGHRGPHELEVSMPGADEDPGWLDRQLEDFRKMPVDIEGLLKKQREEYEKALKRLGEGKPRRYSGIRSRLDSVSRAACRREELRGEFTRINRVVRCFALKAGQVTGLMQDIFLLEIEEILELLSGKENVKGCIASRRDTYNRYCSLPPYPALVNGRFDMFSWAMDPNRRGDMFDSHSPGVQVEGGSIKGFAGAAGVVEGVVRRLGSMEEAELFKPGEILVTVTANIGWTPLFPRAAAIVTDVGAPLSHAAIVARELGIPAVVGCGNATALLHTGDRVSVDGMNGTVRILEAASGAASEAASVAASETASEAALQ